MGLRKTIFSAVLANFLIFLFATLVASFLLGIALGGAVAARTARSQRSAALGLIGVELLAGVLSVAAYRLLPFVPSISHGAGTGISGLLFDAGLAAAILLPSTLCFGATFPFAVRLLTSRADEAGESSARVYAWNTMGAILGSIGSGFVFVPLLGFTSTVVSAAGLNLVLALAASGALPGMLRRALLGAATAALAIGLLRPTTPRSVLRNLPLALGQESQQVRGVTYYAVGRSATVLLTDLDNGWRLRTNGLPESMISRKGARPGMALTARWLGALPAFAPGRTRRELVVGPGGGVDLESIPSTVDEIDVIELELQVVKANERIAGDRWRDPLSDPRVRVFVNDARGALMLTKIRFDAIVSQRSHPWTPGASHLYTRDFFALAKSRLRPHGVFVQWIGLPFADLALLRTLTASLLDVFGNVRVYQPNAGGALFIASDGPLDLESQVPAGVAAVPQDAAELGIRSPEDLAALLILDEAGARQFSAGAPINTDDNNLFATRSPLVIGSPRAPLAQALRALDPYRAVPPHLVPEVVGALHAAAAEMGTQEGFHGYGPDQGYDFLVEAIREHDYAARGLAVAAEEIFVSDGSKQDSGNIQEIFGAQCRIAVTDPAYPVYVDTNVMAGRAGAADRTGRYAGIPYIPATEANDFSPGPPEEPADLAYLCSPNNPTGSVIDCAKLAAWVAWAHEHDAVLIFDAAYDAFIQDPRLPRSIYEVDGAREFAIEMRSFSKRAGFTGVRCAYSVIPKELTGSTGAGERVPLRTLWARRQATKFNGVPYVVQRAAAAVFTPEGRKQTPSRWPTPWRTLVASARAWRRQASRSTRESTRPTSGCAPRKGSPPGTSSTVCSRTPTSWARRARASAPPARATSGSPPSAPGRTWSRPSHG